MTETGLTKNRVIADLVKSTHGSLGAYIPVCQQATREDPQFMAHLIAWNAKKGQVRDSKIALPIITLGTKEFVIPEFVDNSLAHLMQLDVRNLLKAFKFAVSIHVRARRMRDIKQVVKAYLLTREQIPDWWRQAAVQHRRTLKELYAQCHIDSEMADRILFKRDYPENSLMEAVAKLHLMSPQEAAGTILERKIPFLVAQGALAGKIKDPDIVLALIDRMTPTELTTNSKFLLRLGVKENPSLKAAYDQALTQAAKSTKATFKTATAADAIDDASFKSRLQALQERQIEKLGGIEGNWLLLVDKSGSMSKALDVGTHVAAALARLVKGRVHQIFFDTLPRYVDATGKTYEELMKFRAMITAGGGTSIGCGLLYAIEKGLAFDGIAIVSDGGENTAPTFPATYFRYTEKEGVSLPIYFYRVRGDTDELSPFLFKNGIDVTIFEVDNVDYYSLPNLVQTMRTNRYSLIEEIMETPLLESPVNLRSPVMAI